MKPLIGITPDHDAEADRVQIPRDYFRSVEKAGGTPVLLGFPMTEADAAAVLGRIDGLLLTGGVDVAPHLYGEEPIPALGKVDPDRDASEALLIRGALARDMPILAICRGIQVLAAVTGGTLYQDVYAQNAARLKHYQQGPRDLDHHTVSVRAGTKLLSLLGAPLVKTNSRHHQAVKDVPPGFVVSATAEDGLIEAMESTQHRFVVGVQWHPENFNRRTDRFDGLFGGLVLAAQATVRR